MGGERIHLRAAVLTPGVGSKPKKSAAETWKALPEVWALLQPRKGVLLLGFALMAVNRVSGLVLPASTKFLVDNIIGKRQIELLGWLIFAVVCATLLQGLTSFTLTQLLSKSAQRMITDMRKRIQAHVGRLPVTYYDSHKTGELVSRIMSDVEGVRNLIGTGLVEFLGGLLTAVLAFFLLLHISAAMTLVAFVCILVFGLALRKAFSTIRPIFRERSKINAEVSGRLTESLGGVRVIKGYHAEEREEKVFAGGVHRLLDNVMRTLTATSLMSLSASVLLGLVGAATMFVGGRQMVGHTLTPGGYISYNLYLVFLVAPILQVVSIGTQITEALAGLERTQEILNERPEDQDPRRTVSLPPITGDIEFNHVSFSYDGNRDVL